MKTRFILFILLLLPVFLIAQTASPESEKNLALKIREANKCLYSEPQKAIDLSYEVFKETTDYELKITALAIIINGYSSLHEVGKALEYSEEAMKIAQKSNSIPHQIWALGLMGEQYQVGGQNTISRELLDRAKNLIASADFSEESEALALGNIYAIIGNGYKDEIDCKYAIQNYDKAIQAYKPFLHNSAAKNNLALVYLEKGDCLLELNTGAQAKEYYQKAIQISEESGLREYLQRGKTALAKAESELNNFEISSALATELLHETNSNLPVELKNSLFQTLAANRLKTGNLESFKKYESEFLRTSEELNAVKNRVYEQVLDFMEHNQPEKNQLKNNYLYVLLIPFAGIGIFELCYKKRRKHHAETD